MLRFAVAHLVDERVPAAFPWGTFVVNAVGCLAIGVVATLADEAELVTPMVRLFVVGGVLGGFTTFSTFGIETWQLVEDGRAALALTYAAGSLVAGVAGVVIGVAATRSLF